MRHGHPEEGGSWTTARRPWTSGADPRNRKAAAAAFEAVHIYFPDPWPKDKHRRHRLIDEKFPALAQRILVPGGIVHLRTDDPDYFAQMQESFAPAKDFSSTETPKELAALTTEFERQWNEEGKPTLRVSYLLKN